LIFFDNLTDEMIVYINIFGVRMILIISNKCNNRLVVREEGGDVELGLKNLRNKRAKP